jgi:hypothetical protein
MAHERERNATRLHTEPTDEGNMPGRPSAGATLIVIIALLAGLIYFAVSRTATPGLSPTAPAAGPVASK